MTSPLELLPNTYRPFFSGFSALTTAQKQLILPILNGEDVILQAGTGSGKTEAVLAPATEKLMNHCDHFTIIYIVPTRALALDMNRRIKPIYKKLGLKSGIRTGDGKDLRDAKPHLLIMTPESLDVMLGSQNQDNKYFLKAVHMIIIDEVHLFLHDDRGRQLSYLRKRLALQSTRPLQTVALSATIDNAEDLVRFFGLSKPPFYYKEEGLRKLQPRWVHIEDEEQELVLFFNDLYRQSGCKKLLVFANSRKKCEQLYATLSQEAHFSEKVFLHYSNLSTQERKSIETSFRNGKMGICIATSTLELGIDIGDVDGVVLMGPPPSTMAFLQRIGRGNRREEHINFWGICYGQNAGMQLVRFLAFFELAKEHKVEKCLSSESYSVLLQQILSCLYAKRVLSEDSLHLLFKEKSEDISSIFRKMIENKWLKETKQPGIYDGGWRYFSSLKKMQIWSNFPPTEEEYDVILEYEKIAVLPLSMVRQLEVGDRFRLTGKVLRVLQIEEKKAASEVLVEESNENAGKELVWMGFGPSTPFEVAQKMSVVLLGDFTPQGLLSRTRKLLEQEREKMARSFEQSNGIWTHRLENGMYRYETFLGSVANYILHHLIEMQLASKIEGLSVNFDEIGLECNEWIPFESLKIPHTNLEFQEWIASHLPLLKKGWSWNSWIHWLPEEHQQKEIASRFYDPRVLKYFERYTSELKWVSLPKREVDNDNQLTTNCIDLKGEPWSYENERNAWDMISFPNIPSGVQNFSGLTATQVQGYVTQNLCPRWARFQQLELQIESHPRFSEIDQERKSKREQGVIFKKKVIGELQTQTRVCFEELNLQQAIRAVIIDKKPLFLTQAKLEIEGGIRGSPDLIYIQHQGSHICLEVWDIKFSKIISYAQKWRIAFYAHLLETLIKPETFSLPVKISSLGGLVYPSLDQEKRFEKAPFILAPYRTWMPRLIAQWKTDSGRSSAAQSYFLESSCTSCRYFSYCYQETLLTDRAALQNQAIVSKNIESNDFPKNSKHWYFIHYDKESIRWQCWENGVSISSACFDIGQLQEKWMQSGSQGKNPHFLVYESTDWYLLQKILWSTHLSWSSIQTILQTHFIWPIDGRMTATQVGACLGFSECSTRPLSLYHKEPFSDVSFDLCRQIWNWTLVNVKSRLVVSFESSKANSVSLIDACLAIHQRESECRMFDILEFQKNSLPERIKQFRAIGPIRFIGGFSFSIDANLPVSKFRVGDFLKLSPVGTGQIQDGFSVVLESYSPEQGVLSVRPLSRKMSFSRNQLYALDEDATDWNGPKITTVLNLLKNPKFCPEVMQMILGHTKSFVSKTTHWIEEWYQERAPVARLNDLQKQALMLPFREKIGLIEGPPGTGKTHLLVWTLIALVAHAKFRKSSIKILVTAQTHHAIDQILIKVAKTLPVANVSDISLYKYGRFDQDRFSKLGIEEMQDSEALYDRSSFILGATGYGIYELLKNKKFPKLFDFVVFDESSQILTSYALLSLIFGKGQVLFYGDTQQLSPVLKGNYETTPLCPRSILQELISRYSAQNRLRLNETYRMNSDICKFASEMWYDGELQSAVPKNDQKLELPNYPMIRDHIDEVLDPAKSMVALQLDQLGSKHSSEEEAKWIANAVKRLMDDYSISSEQIGIISPHRLQNNTILSALKETLPFLLKLPRVDTVERMQGSEFDIVIFSATISDKDLIHSHFLKDYRRFNVSLTRARKKFIFVASELFFRSFPRTEKELIAQIPFEKFFRVACPIDYVSDNI